MDIKLMQVTNGDFIHISYGNKKKVYNIIIDTGYMKHSSNLKKLLTEVKNRNEVVDALFITHIHNDHINGFLKFLKIAKTSYAYKELLKIIEMVYINDGKVITAVDNLHSGATAVELLKLLKTFKLNYYGYVVKGNNYKIGEANIKILTPIIEVRDEVAKILCNLTDEDDSLHSDTYYGSTDIDDYDIKDFANDDMIENRASISFVLELDSKKYLFMGDAWVDDVNNSLQEYYKDLKFEFVKLAHHGSSANINEEFLDLIDCNKFIISRKKSLEKKVLKLLLDKKNQCTLYCNYDWYSSNYFTQNDEKKYRESKRLLIEEIN